MALSKNYFVITWILLFTALVASALSTWILQHTSSRGASQYSNQLWSTLGFAAFVGWSTLIITGIQALLYYSNLWKRFINELNQRIYLITHTIYMTLYTIFWLAIAGSVTSSIPGNCGEAENCQKVQACAAFAWLTEICFIISLIFLAVIIYHYLNGTLNVNTGPILPTKAQNANAPTTVPMANRNGNTASHLIERLCLQCHTNHCVENSVFCGANCVLMSRSGAPKLVELPAAHYMYRKISNQFKDAWTHPTTKPTPQHIFVIVSTEDNDRMYTAYREGIESQRNFRAQNMQPGNEQQRWHGTTRECKLGDPGQSQLCTSTSCPMCSIIRYSYDIDRFGPRWGRFGKGIYTSSTSSKSNDYSKTLGHSQWTALLLNSVVVGNPFIMHNNSPQLLHPPADHDSILGQPGGALNYDETVVYRNDAIRPVYLVLYLTPRGSSN